MNIYFSKIMPATWACVVACLLLPGSETAYSGEINPEELPAEEFLRYARRPFTNEAWGYFSGSIQHRDGDGRKRIPVELSLLFKTSLMRAQLVLDDTRVYNITQVHLPGRKPHVTITEPEGEEGKATLKDIGLRPQDITFSFLYWDFVSEHEKLERVRGQECRVMILKNPRDESMAEVWFSARYIFPLRVRLYKENGDMDDARELEFTDFKRHGDIWYVKALRLEGKNWRSRVRFANAELAYTEETPPPANLFAPDLP